MIFRSRDLLRPQPKARTGSAGSGQGFSEIAPGESVPTAGRASLPLTLISMSEVAISSAILRGIFPLLQIRDVRVAAVGTSETSSAVKQVVNHYCDADQK